MFSGLGVTSSTQPTANNSGLAQLANAFAGATLVNSGTQIAVQGAQLSGEEALQGGIYSQQVYQTYAQEALMQGNYDQAVEKSQYNRELGAVSNQIVQVTSHNQALMGGAGISVGSKSYQAVADTYLSQTENTVIQLRNTELQKEQQTETEALLQANELTNQGNAAVYRGEVDNVSAQYKASALQYQGTSAILSGAGKALQAFSSQQATAQTLINGG